MKALPFTCDVQPVGPGAPPRILQAQMPVPVNGGECPGNGGGGCGGDPPNGGSGNTCLNQLYNELPSPGWTPYFPHLETEIAVTCAVEVATA